MSKYAHALSLVISCIFLLQGCATSDNAIRTKPYRHATPNNANIQSLDNNAFWQSDAATIWVQLQQTPIATLEAKENTGDSTINGWIKLALINRQDNNSTARLAENLLAWRSQYPQHPANTLIPSDTTLNELSKTTTPQHIALLLPLQGKYSTSGNTVKEGFLNAYYANLSSTPNQQTIAFYDTNSNPSIAALYQQAISKGADIIIGPLTKDQVKQLMNTTTFSVPTIALNYTELNWLSSLPNNLYQFGLSPLDETKQLAEKAAKAGLSHAIIIAPNSEWGKHTVKALVSSWQASGGSVTDTLYFSKDTKLSNDIAQLMHIDVKTDREKTRDKENKTTLSAQRRQDFDVIFLLASAQNARVIIPLLRFYYVDNIPIYATSIVYTGTPNPQSDLDLNGVIFCDIPGILNGQSSDRLFSVGHDAYLISQNLSRLSALPSFPIFGATGALTLTPQRQFYRRLTWAQIHNGQP